MYGSKISALTRAETHREILNTSKDHYQNEFESLKRTLSGLSNPFLLSFIGKKLNTISQSAIDVTCPDMLRTEFDEPCLPPDLKKMIHQFLTFICTYCTEDISLLHQRVEETKREISDLASHLASSNQTLMQSDARWEDFQLLCSIP